METLEKNIVATLKAEIINEFEFTPATERVSRHSDEIKITHPFTSDYKAKVAVKVGNAVKNLIFKEHYNYGNSFRDENDHFHSGNKIHWLGLEENPFKELKEAGIEVDYLEVLMQYQKMVEEAKHQEVLLERWNKWENIRKAKRNLATSWIHDFETIIKNDPNKKIKEAVKQTTFAPSTKWNERHYVSITYKNIVVPIHKIDGSFCFNNEKYGYGMSPSIKGSDENIEIAEGKLRRAKREGTIFLKAMEEVEIYFKQKEYRINARKKELAQINETKKHLEEVLGMPVIVTEKRKYSRERNSNYSWMEKNYFLLLEQPKSKYSSPEIIKIFKNEDKFGIGGLGKLRRDQFKQIINVILDGRKPLKKLEVPTE